MPLQPAPMTSTTAASPETRQRANAPTRQQEVFSINFLRHESLPVRVRRMLLSLAVVYILAQIGVAGGLVAMSAAYNRQGHQVQRQITGGMPSAVALKSLRQAMSASHADATEELAQLNAFLALERERFPVGGKLAVLTKTLPPRTWITSIAGNRERHTITIQASYFVDPENPYALPTKEWLEALKQDPAFSHGLKRLELGTSSRKSLGRSELFTFELIGEWDS